MVNLERRVVVVQRIFGIYRGHRSGFGTAVAFVDFFTELEAECRCKFRAQGFGASNNHAHVLEHQRVHIAAHRKGTQEGRRCDQAGYMEFRTNAGHGLYVGGVCHCHNRATFGQVQEGRNRKAKAMEQREFRKHHVAAAYVNNACKLLNVTHQVPMAEHNALRSSLGTGTEHDNSGIVNLGTLAENKANEPARHNNAEEQESRNLCLRDFFHQVFGVKNAKFVRGNFRVVVPSPLQFLDKLPARNDRRHVGAFAAVFDVFDRRGVVQVDVGLAHDPEHQVHNHASRARREHDTDILFIFAKLFL